jgi:metal transporter CNNM
MSAFGGKADIFATFAAHELAACAAAAVLFVGPLSSDFANRRTLNWLLGPEGLCGSGTCVLSSLDTSKTGGEMSRLEGIGASNFFDLDDISLCDEGEPLDPKSIISLPIANGRPQLPNFKYSPETLLLRQVNASGRKWVVVVGDQGQPMFVLDAHRFLRGAFFGASK